MIFVGKQASKIIVMVIRVVKFSRGGYKSRKIFAYESTHPKEILRIGVLSGLY